MPRHQRHLDGALRPVVPGVDVQVGAADAGPQHAHLRLAGTRRRLRHLGERQAGGRAILDERPHGVPPAVRWIDASSRGRVRHRGNVWILTRAVLPGTGSIRSSGPAPSAVARKRGDRPARCDPPRRDRDTYGPYVALSCEGTVVVNAPVSAGTVSARIVAALEPHVSDVFGVMGNGNAWFLDAVVASSMDLHPGAARVRLRRGRRRLLPRERTARRRHHDLRPRLHERDHAARRVGAGTHPDGARDGRRSRTAAPVGHRPARRGRGGGCGVPDRRRR